MQSEGKRSALGRRFRKNLRAQQGLHSRFGALDIDAHGHGAGTVQRVGGHEGAVLGEGAGEDRRESQPQEAVTICDHLILFLRAEHKCEVLREPLSVSLDGLVERFGCNAVQISQIGIQDDPLATDGQDASFKNRGSAPARCGPSSGACASWGSTQLNSIPSNI
jgi:hypothetical protein